MAAKPNLEGMSFEELMELKEAVDNAVADKADAKRRELMAQLEALDAATGRAPIRQASEEQRKRGTPAPKYQSKKSPSVTWSGRGALAGWLKAEMEETGLPKEAFLIEQQAA